MEATPKVIDWQRPKVYSYIRFSTPEQLKGDSLRRQLQYAEKYAMEHGLELDETLRFQDLGISAYKGIHRTKGALADFLRLVEEGRIPKGSVLVVESLDRLSREQVLEAFQLFCSIIRAGIRIITASDGAEYDSESLNSNFASLIVSLVIMARAHEESEIKSLRLRAAWEAKRQRISEKKLTAQCPAWLKLSKDRTRFLPIAERVEAVKQIFLMKLEGKGSERIAIELNQGPYWKPEKGWRKSFVNKILRNPAVIGQFQPHKKVNGKRIPIGEPIADYFPAVVDKDLFYRVQDILRANAERAGRGGGRIGKVRNLFSHLAFCGYCGAPMRYENKGNPPKGAAYLVCDNAKRGLGCARYYIKYEEVEGLILQFCKGLRPEDVLPDQNEQNSKISTVQKQMASLEGELHELGRRISNITDAIAGEDDKRIREELKKRLGDYLKRKDELISQKANLEATAEKLAKEQRDLGEHLQEIGSLLEYMKGLEGEELIDFRLRLRSRLRALIDRIDIYPIGSPKLTREDLEGNLDEIVDELKRQGWSLQQIEGYLERILDDDERERRVFVLRFRTGTVRVLKPEAKKELVMEAERKKGGIPVYIDLSRT